MDLGREGEGGAQGWYVLVSTPSSNCAGHPLTIRGKGLEPRLVCTPLVWPNSVTRITSQVQPSLSSLMVFAQLEAYFVIIVVLVIILYEG